MGKIKNKILERVNFFNRQADFFSKKLNGKNLKVWNVYSCTRQKSIIDTKEVTGKLKDRWCEHNGVT